MPQHLAPNRLLFQAVFLLPREHGSHCCGIITAVSQVEGHVVLSLDMFQLDAEIDMGIFKGRRKDEHQHVRVEFAATLSLPASVLAAR